MVYIGVTFLRIGKVYKIYQRKVMFTEFLISHKQFGVDMTKVLKEIIVLGKCIRATCWTVVERKVDTAEDGTGVDTKGCCPSVRLLPLNFEQLI